MRNFSLPQVDAKRSAQLGAPGRAMSGLARSFALFLSFAGLLLGATNANALACTSAANGNWNAAATWLAPCNIAGGPVAGDTVTIAAAHTVTVTAPAAATSITITAPSVAAHGVNINPGIVLSVSGAITMTAPAANNRTSTFAVGTGTLNAGSIAISGGTGGTRVSQLTVGATGIVNVTGAVTMGGTAAQSRFIATGASTITVGGAFSPGAFTPGASTLTVSGNFTPTAMVANTGTVILTGGAAQSMRALTTYNNVIISKTVGTIATLAGNTSMTGSLTVTSGTLNKNTRTLGVAGNFAVNGVITGTSGNITLSGAAATINGTGSITTTTGVLSITTAKTILATANLTIASPITLSANVTVTNNGIINKTTTTALNGANATTSIWVNAANSTLNYAGTNAPMATGVLTASAVGNTVNYNGAAQTVKVPSGAPATYYHLTLSGSGAKTMPATAMTVTGNFTMSGAAGTSATAAQALTVGGNFSIGATNTFANGANALNVAGNFAQNGTFTAGAGVVTLNGGAAVQTISGAGTLGFANLTINNTGGITLARNVTVTSAIIGAHTLTSTCPTDWTLTSNVGALVEHSCPTPTPPTVTTNAATALTASGATLNGTVSSNGAITTVTFDYGLTTGYGSTATATASPLAAGAVNAAVSAPVTGLSCNTLYHFRATGVNSAGTTNGGDLTFTTSACPTVVINTYYPGTASVTAGATSITLGAATGAATPIAIGDMLLIMQMQDATIDSTNTATYGTVSGTPTAGKYEYVLAASAVPLGGGTLTLSCGTLNAYTNANYVAGSSGQKRFQVIRVPVYASYAINAITALAWNGSTGGVLAFDVTGVLTLNSATVTVDGKGFRGGASRMLAGGAGVNTDYRTLATVNNNASKGEGIAGTPFYVFTAPSTLTNTGVEGYPNGSHARGAPANGGGGGTDRNPVANDQNPGGGGGANAGAGGLGGIGWCPTFNAAAPPLYGCGPNSGGLGGNPVTGLGATRLPLGGGGGGATSNNGTGIPAAGLASSGAAGGGSIMIRAGSMTGVATFNANGSAANNTIGNDGSGGGGAGGTVMLLANSGMAGATINVNGGSGGTNLIPPLSSGPHGPGGGGGGGYAITPAATAACNNGGGVNGVTYNGGVLFGAYGSTPGSAGSCVTSLTAASIPGVALGAASCTPPLDHLEIQHGSGTGLTCAASTLTIKACTDAAVPCVTPYTSGVSGTLTATGAPTVNWDGTTGGAAGAGFVIPNGSSSVTKDVQVATAGTVVFGIASPSPVPASATACNFGTPACTFTASLAGFIFSDTTTGNSYTIPAQVSGIASPTLYLRAVQASTTNPAVCTPAIISQPNVSVNMGYVCNNPASCQAGNLATINATAIAPGGTAVSLNFDANGSAPITTRYDDVGQITLNANKTVTPFGGATPVTLNGNSNPFVVAPHHFDFSNITPGLIKAGNNFSATVTAYNGLATPTVAPNFGKESVVEGVTLTSNLGAGNNPAISNNVIPGSEFGAGGMVNDANGVATVNNLSWGEVGLITMTANLTSGSYLGSGLTASGTSGNVGRFIPDHFDTAVVLAAGVPMICPTGLTCPALYNGFVYSGQAFSVQVTAKNLSDNITANYDSTLGFSKNVTLTAWDAKGSTTTQNPGSGSLNVAVPLAAADFVSGVGVRKVAGNPTPYVTYVFSTTPTNPTDIYVRAADTDSVISLRAVAANSVEGGIKIASGRYKIANAYGSELLPLAMNVAVQYHNGTTWALSSTDSLTSFNSALSPTGNVLAAIVSGLGGGVAVSSPSVAAVVAGIRTFRLAAPGVRGSADITINAPTYLQSIAGRATFGVYKGSNEFIYLREMY